MLTRRTLILWAALLSFGGSLALSPAAARADDRTAGAVNLIRDLGARAIDVLGQPDLTHAEAYKQFGKLLNQGFDVTYIGRFVLGPYWNQATPAQRQEYLKLFQQLIIKVYADRFSQYAGRKLNAEQTLKILGSRAVGDHDTVVSTQINQPDGPPVKVDWRVRDRDGKEQIIDVAVEGVSMSVTQRNEFGAVIQRGGGSVQALLNALQQRVG